MFVLGVVKRNPLFLHEIEWKNNGFLFTTPNMTWSGHLLNVRLSQFRTILNTSRFINPMNVNPMMSK